jgi:predicted double-glycine peptidase
MAARIVSIAVAALLTMHAAARADTLRLSAAGGDFAVPLSSMRTLRFQSTLRQRYDFSCGSAALATLLTHHYGHPVGEDAVFAAMYVNGDQQKIRREGFSLLDMKRYLESIGFAADGFVQPLDKLAGAHLPAIVLISDHGYHHFVIVKGLRGDRVLLGDPSAGTRAVPRATFEAMWVNRLLFVVHNRRELARFNDDADWLAAPAAPLAAGIDRSGLGNLTLPGAHGAGAF